MKIFFVGLCAVFLVVVHHTSAQDRGLTAIDLIQNIYEECVQDGSFSCVKPKIFSFLSSSMSKDKIKLTRDLTIVSSDSSKSSSEHGSTLNEIHNISGMNDEEKEQLKLKALDKMDEFLYNHELRIRIPKEILSSDMSAYVPSILTKNLPEEIKIPLADGDQHVQGRSKKFLKRVIMPFLIGLKFKVSTLIPIAFAIIALKTWKALTLALLSVVLSGAMVIFKFNKAKTHYEVIHYPQPLPVFDHHAHVVPHGVPVHDFHTDYAHAHGRQLDAHEMAFRGQS